jgi:hypothetical protein
VPLEKVLIKNSDKACGALNIVRTRENAIAKASNNPKGAYDRTASSKKVKKDFLETVLYIKKQIIRE